MRFAINLKNSINKLSYSHCCGDRTLCPSGPATVCVGTLSRRGRWDTSPARPALCGPQTRTQGTDASYAETPPVGSPGCHGAVAATTTAVKYLSIFLKSSVHLCERFLSSCVKDLCMSV